MRRHALAAIAAAGCGSIYHASEDDTPRDATRDAVSPLTSVTGSYTLRDVDLGAQGVSTFPFAAADITITATLDDGTTADVTYHAADGSFELLAHPGRTYRLRVQTPGLVEEYELDRTQIALVALRVGHVPDPPAVSPGTGLGLRFNALVQSDYTATTTGVWSSTALPHASFMNDHFPLDWHGVVPLSGPLGLLSAARGDMLYVTRTDHEAAHNPGAVPAMYTAIAAASSLAVTMVDSADPTIDVPTPSGVPAACGHLHHDETVDLPRLRALRVNTDAQASGSAAILALPAPQLGVLAPIVLAVADTTPGDKGVGIVVDQAQIFLNPFPTTVTAALATVGVVHAIGAHVIADSLTYTVPFTPGDAASCPDVTLPHGGPLATAIMADGVPLTADGATVAATGSDLAVTWTMDGDPGLAADVYFVSLTSLVEGKVEPVTVRAVFTTATAAHFPRSDLAANVTYLVRVDAIHGLPTAPSGDWSTRNATAIRSTSWSHTFRRADP